MLRAAATLLCILALAACSSGPTRSTVDPGPFQGSARADKSQVISTVRPGAYYKDDGPGDNPPDLDKIADAQPRAERMHRFANNPYEVFGKAYVPLRASDTFKQRGIGSWYGRRFHGQSTSSGDIYDMYGMTAAHPTLPIPSYVRVTNLSNGRSVVVRVNDRGPFHAGRVVDLSFVAAYKLGYAESGSALVEVESIVVEAPVYAAAPAEAPKPAAEPQAARAPKPAPVRRAAPVRPAQPPSSGPPAPMQAQVPTSPSEDNTQLPVTTDAKGVYLQLGAFSVRENADSFRGTISRELAWLTDTMQVIVQGGLFRLHLGPYRTQEDARQVAERIRVDLNLKPIVLVR